MTDEQIQKKTENVETSTTNADSEKRSHGEGASAIEQANTAAERLEKANAKKEELIKREEQLEAYKRLGGRSSGNAKEEKKQEETPQEYAKRVIQGRV